MSERVRCQMAVGERVRWLSHLEFLRAVFRAVRRANISVQYSEGYNPHPQISFAIARPVGLSSDAEFLDVHLRRPVPAGQVEESLHDAMPPGLSVLRVAAVPPDARSLNATINASRYSFFLPHEATEKWNEAARKFLAKSNCEVERQRWKKANRMVNIRPHVYRLQVAAVDGGTRVDADMALGGENNVRPEEMVRALMTLMPEDTGEELLYAVRMHRSFMYRREDDQEISPWDLI